MLALFTLREILAELQKPLVVFGFAAQFVFLMRFVVQWYASERRGQSVIPVAFWHLSCIGGVMILIYAVLKGDLVFTAASLLSLVIYVRNLILIHRTAGRAGDAIESA